MPVAVEERFYITSIGKILTEAEYMVMPEEIRESSDKVKPYTPPQFLIKVTEPNKGQLFPWHYYRATNKAFEPYTGPGPVLTMSSALPSEPAASPDASSDNSTDDSTGLLDRLCAQNSTSRLQEIVNAIGRLDADKDFGGRGLPKLEALHRELDETVSYPELQAAWKEHKGKGK